MRAAALDAAASPAPSAARLAAEAVFSAPAVLPGSQGPAPLVIVKRARRVLPLPADAAPTAGLPDAQPDKGPRIFRLPTPGPAMPAVQEPVPAAQATVAPVLRRRRRPDDRRPGPVLQLVAPPPPPPRKPEPADWLALADELAALAPVLAAIERAQAFRFMPDDHGAEWQALQQQAEALAKQIRAARR